MMGNNETVQNKTNLGSKGKFIQLFDKSLLNIFVRILQSTKLIKVLPSYSLHHWNGGQIDMYTMRWW